MFTYSPHDTSAFCHTVKLDKNSRNYNHFSINYITTNIEFEPNFILLTTPHIITNLWNKIGQ